jgi:hypothetical protein
MGEREDAASDFGILCGPSEIDFEFPGSHRLLRLVQAIDSVPGALARHNLHHRLQRLLGRRTQRLKDALIMEPVLRAVNEEQKATIGRGPNRLWAGSLVRPLVNVGLTT